MPLTWGDAVVADYYNYYYYYYYGYYNYDYYYLGHYYYCYYESDYYYYGYDDYYLHKCVDCSLSTCSAREICTCPKFPQMH